MSICINVSLILFYFSFFPFSTCFGTIGVSRRFSCVVRVALGLFKQFLSFQANVFGVGGGSGGGYRNFKQLASVLPGSLTVTSGGQPNLYQSIFNLSRTARLKTKHQGDCVL